MCFSSKSGNTDPPPPSTPTRFDYTVAQRGDSVPMPPVTSITPLSTFGSELGTSAPTISAKGAT